RKCALHRKDLRQPQHIANAFRVTSTGIPDCPKSAKMSAQHHVIGGSCDTLYHREVVMGPALLKAQVDQRCAIAEMRVSAGKFSGSTLLLRIRHQHEMPMLLVTRGRCLKAIADDGKQEIRVEGRAVKSTAGNTLC